MEKWKLQQLGMKKCLIFTDFGQLMIRCFIQNIQLYVQSLLQIYYEDAAIVPATVQEQQNTEDLLYLLSIQGNALGKLAEMVDGANIRAALQASAAVIGSVTQSGSWTLTTVTTVSTVTTCSTLTNQTQNGGQPTNDIVPNASNTLATLANINNVTYT